MATVATGHIHLEDAAVIKVRKIRRWWKSEVAIEVDSTNEKTVYDLRVNDSVRVHINIEFP